MRDVPPPAEALQLRVLFIGDPHVTVEELEDCQRLLDLVDRVTETEQPFVTCFLGDQHHNHAVVRVEVMDLWARWLEKRKRKTWMLVGNHDRSHDTALRGNTLRYYGQNVEIISEPMTLGRGMVFLPWYANPKDFIASAGEYNTVVCHQTLQGAKYENGFPAADGVPAESVPAKLIISGHIHTPQMFGKVWYPGAPRWRIATDANVERSIWACDFDWDGNELARRAYSTTGVCRALYQYTVTEDDSVSRSTWPDLPQPYRLAVDIHGRPEFVASETLAWKGRYPGCRVNPFPTRQAKHVVRESDGVPLALKNYITAYQPKFGTTAAQLQKMVADRVRL